ncbi:MAG: hypothetical protein M3Q58_11620, partial [Bacteroidota bacterium]|nr:hypothetical protein [Bacteroidota bacterium]
IISIELSNITKEPFYHVRVYNAPIDTVYVAEKFLSETSQDKLGFINDPKMLEECVHNSQFQLDNVIGWMNAKDYECALIKAKCLVEELERTIKIKAVS